MVDQKLRPDPAHEFPTPTSSELNGTKSPRMGVLVLDVSAHERQFHRPQENPLDNDYSALRGGLAKEDIDRLLEMFENGCYESSLELM
jgi:hypothetical protein